LIRKGSRKLYIVEGLTDALTISQLDHDADILILHSAVNANKLPDISHYEEILVATDNDEQGEQAYEKIKEKYPYAERYRYEGKDPMDAWLSGTLEQKTQINYQKKNTMVNCIYFLSTFNFKY